MSKGVGENGKRYSEQQQILGSEKSESMDRQPGAASTGASSRYQFWLKGRRKLREGQETWGDMGKEAREGIQSRGKID